MDAIEPRGLASLDDVRFDEQGLVPTIVQDARSGEVLMMAYMNQESLERTIDTGETWFFSRARQALWRKGATTGNTQTIRWMRLDCDGDTLLIGVEQAGWGACHVEGQRTCFFRALDAVPSTAPDSFDILVELARVIADRQRELPEGSYTTSLLKAGIDEVAKKVGEEAIEVAIAAKNHVVEASDKLAGEVADLIYHLFVLARMTGLDEDAVYRALAGRRGRTSSK